MSESFFSHDSHKLSELSAMEQQRMLLLDIQTEHTKWLYAHTDRNGSLVEKAIELAVIIGEISREDVNDDFDFYMDPDVELEDSIRSNFEAFTEDNKLARVMIAKAAIEIKGKGRYFVPAIRFERWDRAEDIIQRLKGRERPSNRAHIPLLLPKYEDIPMAGATDNGEIFPIGDFNDVDVEMASGKLATLELARSKYFQLLPNLNNSLSNIIDPNTGIFVRAVDDGNHPDSNYDPYDIPE
jgi:hypothetical protein